MPNRMLKDCILTSERISKLTWFERVVYDDLIVYLDDYGRGDARPAILRAALFPLNENVTKKAIADALNRLATLGLVALYEVDGRPFLALQNWEKHQQIRSKFSKFPEPPSDNGCYHLIADDNGCYQLISDDNKCAREVEVEVQSRSTNTDEKPDVVENEGKNTPAPERVRGCSAACEPRRESERKSFEEEREEQIKLLADARGISEEEFIQKYHMDGERRSQIKALALLRGIPLREYLALHPAFDEEYKEACG